MVKRLNGTTVERFALAVGLVVVVILVTVSGIRYPGNIPGPACPGLGSGVFFRSLLLILCGSLGLLCGPLCPN